MRINYYICHALNENHAKHGLPSFRGFDFPKIEEVTARQNKPQKCPAPDGISDGATKIYDLLDTDIITVEQISEKADRYIARILSALTALEIWGLIQTLPGRRIQIR